MIRRLSVSLVGLVAALQLASNVAHAGVDCYAELSAAKNITAAKADTPLGPISLSADGFQLAPGAGCDVGIPDTAFVIGAWLRYDFANVSEDVLTTKTSLDDYWSAGGRLGFKLNDGTLAYGLLGMSKSDLTFAGSTAGRDGIMYGAGLEVEFKGLGVPVALFGQWEHTDWKDRASSIGNIDTETDVFRAGMRIKTNILK